MILSDFHPVRRCIVKDAGSSSGYRFQPSYFDPELKSGDVAYKHYFDEKDQQDFPDVAIRLYTLSKIINSLILTGFKLEKFDEHRGWQNENIPWEFTIVASK